MAKRGWLAFGIAAGMAIALADPVARAQSVPRARVYAAFVSHNEEAATNAPCAPVVTQRDRYLSNRAAVVALARTIVERNAAWDFQSEWQYLQAVQAWDDAAVTGATEGKNIVRYLAELSPAQVAVDAHSHERSGWNYADVAHLLTSLGAPPTGIVGGYIASPSSAETWTRLRAPLRGLRPPYPLWQPLALWGGGSANHRSDANASGVWRPRDPERFFEDDPAQALFNIGGWTGEVASGDGLALLLEKLRTGQLEQGRMFTATIMIPQCQLDVDPALPAAVTAIVDCFTPDVSTGDLVWATLPTMARVWREEYGSQPSMVRP